MAASDDRWDADRRDRSRDRRQADRRSAAERRVEDRGRAQGNRRATSERRSGHDRRNEAAWQPIALEAASNVDYDDAALVAAAVDAREFARAPFSKFKVGAALELGSGAIVTGCNVENATYGLTMCAERVALYKALSGSKDLRFTRIAVVADTEDPTPPCGSCRQLIWEYCGDIEVVLANLSEVKRRLKLAELLPLPFDARLL